MPDKTSDPDSILQDLRNELSNLDGQLLDVVRRRIECCVRIAEMKRLHGIAMMQPGRIDVVHRRAESYGRNHGVSTDFLRDLYNLIITETCRVEDQIIDSEATPRSDDGAE